jgi:hypothetical protein
MNCEDLQQILPLYINHELDHQKFLLVKKHLDSCPGCRSEFSDLHEVDILVKTYIKSKTAPDFQSFKTKSKKRYYYLSAVAAAAVVFYITFSTVQRDEHSLSWENYRLSELMDMNDNLDIINSDYSRSRTTLHNKISAEDEVFYTISEDVDYLQESGKWKFNE